MTESPAGDEGPVAPARTIFFGSGAFAVPILDALSTDPLVELVGIVAAPDRPAGRAAVATAVPVTQRARALGVPLLQPARLRDPEIVEMLRALRPALGVLADYGRLVPPAVLALPPLGFLNIHPSLLPRHRGAAPVPAAILAGDLETGVTLMQMDAGLDTGPLVASVRWSLSGSETAPELEASAATAAARLVVETLPDWLAGRIDPHPQDETAATLTRPLRRVDGRLDGGVPAVEAERRVRAFQPWPGTFIETAVGRVAVLRARVEAASIEDVAGTLVGSGEGVALATVDGRLGLLEIRPAGGRPMSGEAWRRGRPGLLGRVVALG